MHAPRLPSNQSNVLRPELGLRGPHMPSNPSVRPKDLHHSWISQLDLGGAPLRVFHTDARDHGGAYFLGVIGCTLKGVEAAAFGVLGWGVCGICMGRQV